MKRTYTILFLIALLSCITGKETYAQETVPEGYVLVDSVIYRPVAAVDTTLVGKDVFLLMPSREMGSKADVKINQTADVRDAMRRQVARSRTVSAISR